MSSTLKNIQGSIAGKVFLLGEYAVLAGLPAAIVTLGPRFEVEPSADAADFHAESPAGKLLKKNPSAKLGMKFHDPHQGSGGFGASTAQYALVYYALGIEMGWDLSWKAAWREYRELTKKDDPSHAPSGADLVTQWVGGVSIFTPSEMMLEDFSQLLDFSNLLIFSATAIAGRKVATHDHLNSLKSLGNSFGKNFVNLFKESLRPPLELGLQAIRDGNAEKLGLSMDGYAEALEGLGLQHHSTREDRHYLRKLPGVLGVKGAGAMQADALLVWVKNSTYKEKVMQEALARGLKLVGHGGQKQSGIQWQT